MNVRMIFEPHYLWIGVYWTKTMRVIDGITSYTWDVYFCFIPTLPIRFQWRA